VVPHPRRSAGSTGVCDWLRLFQGARSPRGQPDAEQVKNVSLKPLTSAVLSIGIGRGLTASPLPHHRTYGSRIRRCGRWSQGETSPQPERSSPGVPAASSSQRPRIARPLAGCPLAAPPQAATPPYRSGLRPARVAAQPLCSPALQPWGASRASPALGLLGPLLTAAGRSGRMPPPSVLARTPRRSPAGSWQTFGA
jgi:hypothetical protein